MNAGVHISMDDKGRALDNVAVERFWRSLEYEEVYLKDYVDLIEARREIPREALQSLGVTTG